MKTEPTFKFEASPLEAKAIQSFSMKHQKSCQPSKVEIVLSQTGIGVAVIMRCADCGTEKNVTDYGVW